MFPNLPNWSPRSDPQMLALYNDAELMLFGGAAGSLKSETLLADAVAECHHPGLRAILFRRSYPELEKSLIRRSRELYPGVGGIYNEQKRRWTFPAGGTIEFGYCESDNDIYRYQGAEFSFIAFDESTHFPELPIRYMMSRLRSTHPDLKLRVRLATNPGNVGHTTHKHIFQGASCTHCNRTESSRVHYRIYNDAVWPSDQHPIGKTTVFIPGRIGDHSLLGTGYRNTLESLPGAFRKALLDGCWDVYEGQYFDNWDPTRMVFKRQTLHVEDWWPHWCAVDYGFSGSQSAAYLLCKDPGTREFPAGRTYVIEEYCDIHKTAADFARTLKARFDRDDRRILAWYLSPDAWNKRGDGHTLADQMQAATGIGFEPASNDRIGGAMLVYTQLNNGELVIADTCKQLVQALPTRIHDPERPDDILKTPGDPADDCVDALRYAAYSYIGPPRTSAEAEIQKAMTSSDPTNAMMQRRVAEQRLIDASQPIRYMGSSRRRER